MIKKTILSIISVITLIVIWSPATAAAIANPGVPTVTAAATATPGAVKNDCNGPNIQAGLPDSDPNHCGILDYVTIFIKVLSAAVGIVVVISIIIAGIQYSASGDDPNMVTAAKKRIINALLALAVFAFMFALMNYLIPGGIL